MKSTTEALISPRVLSPVRLYAVVALLTVTALVFLTPPDLVSDEPNHFYRAYQVSIGDLRGSVQNGQAGGVLPSSLVAFEQQFLRQRVKARGELGTTFALRETWSTPAIALDPARTTFVGFTQMAIYAPFAYAPQALGIAIGRWAGWDVLPIFLLGRLLNGLAAVALTACALRVLPVGRNAALVAALLPMNLFQYASLSVDAMLISCAFLYTALVLQATLSGSWKASRLAAAIATGALICAAKIVYVPLLFLGAWPALAAWRHDDRRLLAGAVAVPVLGLAVALGWLASISDQMLPTRADVSPAEHAAWLVQHPIAYLVLLSRTLVTHAGPWCLEVIGLLAWSKIWLPAPIYLIAIVGLVSGLLSQRCAASSMSRGYAVWALLLAGSCVVLISTALFVTWSNTADTIEGIQGRYFSPLLFVCTSALSAFWAWPTGRMNRLLYVVGVVCAIVTVAGMIWTIIVTLSLF